MVKTLSLKIWQPQDQFLVGVGKLTGWFDSSETEQLVYNSALPHAQTSYPGKPNTPEPHAVRVTTPLMKRTQKFSSGF